MGVYRDTFYRYQELVDKEKPFKALAKDFLLTQKKSEITIPTVLESHLNEKTLPKQGFLTFNASELLRYVGRSYDGLTAAKAAFSVALGRMTRFTVSRLAW